MDFDLLHPREQIVTIMRRIYDRELTTLSGGNLSICDEDGAIWITPAGIDKGSLTPQDIIKVLPDGELIGPHQPSTELPFHRKIYATRPNLRAVVHAHAPALVTFSIAGKIPDPNILPQVAEICGSIQYAPYAMMGSEELGTNIASAFATGANVVMLENHGVATGGQTLLEAFMRLETLEYCARTIILARGVGECRSLTAGQIEKFNKLAVDLIPDLQTKRTPVELELRQEIVAILKRAYDRRVMTSTEGVVSARVTGDHFLITPKETDRLQVGVEDLVMVEKGHCQQGAQPSAETALHQEIYRRHPEVGCILTAQSPHAAAYAVSSADFDTRTIPEAYYFLRKVPKLDFDLLLGEPAKLADEITERTPVLLIKNFGALVTGSNLMQTYDRLEVLEYTARSLLQLPSVGPLKAIGEEDLRAIEKKFFGS